MENQTAKSKSFEEPDECSTLALEVEGRKFWISREILAKYSPVFKAMLYGKFLESGQNIVPLPGKNAEDVEELLLCLIPMPQMKNIDDSNLELILSFSDEYQIDDLRRRVNNFLRAKMQKCGKSDSKLLYILRVGSKWRMASLLEECIERCATEFNIDVLKALFDDLRSEVIAGLMLYTSTAPLHSLCRFIYSTYDADECSAHTTTVGIERLCKRHMMCLSCGVRLCGRSINEGTFASYVCKPDLTKTRESVKKLLKRM